MMNLRLWIRFRASTSHYSWFANAATHANSPAGVLCRLSCSVVSHEWYGFEATPNRQAMG